MSIQNEPHYELPAAALAEWIDHQGADRWWNVDGDPLLMSHLSFPCPGDELAAEFRRIGRPLLLLDRQKRPESRGQQIGWEQLDALAGRLGENVTTGGPKPTWTEDRVFVLCWKGSDEEWLLVEDKETTESSEGDAALLRESR